MLAYLKIIRLGNCALASTGVIVGAIIAEGIGVFSQTEILQMFFASLVVFFSTAGGNVLNDYTDRDVDRINHPERAIPSGEIKPEHALIYSLVLFALGFFFALISRYWFVLTTILVLAIGLMVAYEFRFKAEGFSGNVIISFLTALVFIFGGAAFGNPLLTVPFAVVSFLGSLYREIVKDIEDIAGDVNRHTLPKKVGIRNAGKIAIASLVAGIGFSILPLFLPDFGFYPKIAYALGIGLANIVFIYSATFTFKSPTKSQKIAKMGMFIATISFLLIGLR
ncbi:MAG: UbiA family prenyltransferase [Thermoplasmata archaeon]